MACMLGAKLSPLFKSLGRKWHRVQNFLKAQSEKGEFLGARNKNNKQSTVSRWGLTYGNPRCSGCCHQHPRWRGSHPGCGGTSHRWSSGDGRPSQWLGGSFPWWALHRHCTAPVCSAEKTYTADVSTISAGHLRRSPGLLLVCLEALGTFFSFLLDKVQYSQQLSKSMITAQGLGQAFRTVWEHKPEPSLSSSDKWSEVAHQVGYLRHSSFCSQEHVKEGVVQPALLGFCLWTAQSERALLWSSLETSSTEGSAKLKCKLLGLHRDPLITLSMQIP